MASEPIEIVEIVEISVTCGSEEEARAIARSLIETRLAACVHISAPLTSIYRWKGKIAEDREWELTAKTTNALAQGAANHIQANHSYDLPVILTRTASIDDDVAAWLASETGTKT